MSEQFELDEKDQLKYITLLFNNSIKGLETSINEYKSHTDLKFDGIEKSIMNLIAEIKKDIGELSKDTSNQKTEVAALKERITSVAHALDQFKGDEASHGKTHSASIDTLRVEMTSQKGEISEIQDIAKEANSMAKDSKERVSSLEKSISKNSSDIEVMKTENRSLKEAFDKFAVTVTDKIDKMAEKQWKQMIKYAKWVGGVTVISAIGIGLIKGLMSFMSMASKLQALQNLPK